MITLHPTECVVYEKKMDSHAIATLTIPVSMTYIYVGFRGDFHQKYFKAGDQLSSVASLMGETCGIFYESMKKELKGKK